MAHRTIRKGKSILWRAAAWLTAYAFVLQTVLAPIAATAASRTVQPESAALIVCAEHAEAVDQTENHPIAPRDHEAICKFCIGCPASALLAPDTLASTDIDSAITPVRWRAVLASAPDRDFLASKQARGPPTLT